MTNTLQITYKLNEFFSKYPLKKIPKGDMVLFADGDVPPVTFLAHGKVAQYDIAENGNKLVLTVYKPGTFFPMAHAINNLPNHYFFEATEDVEVRQAPAVEVVEFIKQNPDVMFDLLSRVYRGMDGLLGRMGQLMAGTARGLLLFELGVMKDRFGEPTPDGVFIKTTAAQLAAQTGLARETISRELQKSADLGLLEQTKGGVILKTKSRG